MYLKHAIGAVALVLMIGTTASSARATGNPNCQTVTGKGQWTLIPSADPLGRVLGPTTGSLKASMSATLKSLTPNPNGSLTATSEEVWVVGPQDVITFDGVATFTPVADAPIGTVADELTLTVASGTGQYAGATGTINVTGTGYNLFGPAAGPGSTFFDIRYRGTICTAN
jgi:hypothetical protein